MNLSAGEHYMQVSKWLGHSSFVLTLSTYADYINEDEQVAPKVGRGVVEPANVVPLPTNSATTLASYDKPPMASLIAF